MNCLYFTAWAQNQLRSGNNKQSCYQLYSSNHLLGSQDKAPLYAMWRPWLCDCRNSCQLSTWLGDPRVFGPHHQRQLVPWALPLSCSPRDGYWKAKDGDSLQNPYSVPAEPRGGQDWRQPGRWKAQRQRRQAVFQKMTSFYRRKMYGPLSNTGWN